MSLIITDGENTVKLMKKYCIPLELIINTFENKNNWMSIGDHLYYFSLNDPKYKNKLTVTNTQFLTLLKIICEQKFNI
tara:strand:+ start:3247 stop:3480 length:234 start_codon:yes stop_codon:yes gene_type:complete